MDHNNEMPEKIPDWILVKELRIEIGKLTSYIHELEDSLKVEKQRAFDLSKLVKSESKKVREHPIYIQLLNHCKCLKKSLKRSEIDKQSLINRLLQNR